MILEAIASVFRNSIENPSVPLSDYNQWGSSSSSESLAGPRVGREQALGLHAVWRAVDLISDTIARLPCSVYRLTDVGRDEDVAHPAYNLLRFQPSPETTSFTFRKTMEAHRLLMGNAYAYVRRLGSGAPQELVILDPDCTFPVRVNGRLSYATRVNGVLEPLRADDVIHLKGLSYDGLVGYPVTHKARDSFGLGLATNQYAGEFFRNGAEPRVVISTPGTMTPDDQTRFLKQWQMMHGEGKRHSTAIITGGGKVEKLSIDAQDAQLIEQRKFTIIEVANWFGLPPHKLGNGDRAAYNSLEQENQSFLDDCMASRVESTEQEYRLKLLSEREKRSVSHAIEIDVNSLMRADMAARSAYYDKAVGRWVTKNEIRALEGLNAVPGGDDLETAAPQAIAGQDGGDTPNISADLREQMETYGIGVRAGSLTPQTDDETFFRGRAGLPALSSDASRAWEQDKGVRRPVTLAAVADTRTGPGDGQPQQGGEDGEPVDVGTAPPTNRGVFANVQASHRALLARSCQKMAERIAGNSKRRAKDPKGFMEWLDEISEHSRAVMVEEFKAPLAACRAVLGITNTADELAERLIAAAGEQLLEVSGAATADGLEGAVNEWSKRFAGSAVNELVDGIFAECKAREAA